MTVLYSHRDRGAFEIELPEGIEEDIETHLTENGQYTSKSELIRDAIRHLLYSEDASGKDRGIHVNQQQIDRVDADSLEEIKSEQE